MQQPSWIGHKLSDRYLIEDELGAGGMSAVYKAKDPNLGRVVAVKLIHAHLSNDPEFVRRFEAEAAVVAQLRHGNIVQVYDFNHDGNTYYIVFEFVPGETLQSRLKRYREAGRQMPLREVMDIALGVGGALKYAHDREIVHRDVKPANVMINLQGEAILTDFGIVKIVGGTQHTATGAVMGTARYMSPEQIRGHKVDARTDIYAFGVMLFEMLGGRAPFSADSAMTLMMMHINDPVPDLRNLRPGLPPALVNIVERALAKDPGQRYQSMTDLVADLRRAQSGQPVTAPAAEANLTLMDLDEGNVATPDVISEYVAPPTAPPPQFQTAERGVPAQQPQFQAAPLGAPAQPAASGGGINKTLWGIIGGIVLLILLAAGLYAIFGRDDSNSVDEAATAAAQVADTEDEEDSPPEEEEVATAVPEDAATELPEKEVEPTLASTDVPPTVTTAPTALPTATTAPPTATSAPPTATFPPPTATFVPPTPTTVTQFSARINSITLEGDVYVVNYETFGYTEALPGQHVHFFFNTVPPDQAGLPGGGPWTVYGGPRPFTQLRTTDRPGNATQMCVLSANPDHSVISGSGNCFNLP